MTHRIKMRIKKEMHFNTQQERRRLNDKDGPIGRIGGKVDNGSRSKKK